jgi:hypothetical protein
MRKQILFILPLLAAMLSVTFGALTSVSAQEVNLTANQSAVEANVTNATIGGNMTGNVSANVTPTP